MLTFAQGFLEWAEQLWTSAFPRHMVQSVCHLQTQRWGLVGFTLNNILPVPEVKPLLELRALSCQFYCPYQNQCQDQGKRTYPQYVQMKSVCWWKASPHCSQLWGQPPKLEGWARDHPQVFHLWQLMLKCLLRSGYWVKNPWMLCWSQLPCTLALVYRNMVTGDYGAYSAASGEGCLRSGSWSYNHWVVEHVLLHQWLFYPNCDKCRACIAPPNDHMVKRTKAWMAK